MFVVYFFFLEKKKGDNETRFIFSSTVKTNHKEHLGVRTDDCIHVHWPKPESSTVTSYPSRP